MAGVRLIDEVDNPEPRARIYGIPTVPSGAVYLPSGLTAIASAAKSAGKDSKPSWVEQLQLDSEASVRPVSAGCVAVMCTRSSHRVATVVNAPNGASTGTGTPPELPLQLRSM